MVTRAQDIASIIKQQIEQFGTTVTMVDVGTVVEVADGLEDAGGELRLHMGEYQGSHRG